MWGAVRPFYRNIGSTTLVDLCISLSDFVVYFYFTPICIRRFKFSLYSDCYVKSNIFNVNKVYIKLNQHIEYQINFTKFSMKKF